MRNIIALFYLVGFIFMNSIGNEPSASSELGWSDEAEIRSAKEKVEYEKYFNTLNSNNTIQPWVYAFSKRSDSIKSALRSVTKEIADTLFLEYYRYATRQYIPAIGQSQFMAKYSTLEADTFKLNPQERILAREFKHQGIVIDDPGVASRGVHFIKNHYLNMFGPYISEELKFLIELKEWEDLGSGYSGCGPSHSFKEMSERITAWEDFLDKYPESNYLPIARSHYYAYLNGFFCSQGDNNPFKIGTHDKDDLLPLFKSFAKKHEHRKSGKIAKKFLELQKKHRYQKINHLPDLLDIGPINYKSDF